MKDRSQIDLYLPRSAIQDLVRAIQEEHEIATAPVSGIVARGFREERSRPRYRTEAVAGGCTVIRLTGRPRRAPRSFPVVRG